MPSITQELDATRTAQWYRAGQETPSYSAWNDRLRCFSALAGILAQHRAPRTPGHRWSQPPVRPHALLSEVARRAHFSSAESVYQRWRAEQNSHTIARWAGPDPSIKPGPAFVAEARIVSFWPYRAGVFQVVDAFDLTLTEVAAAYFRALAAWASDNPVLAACEPAGAPGCVAEDLEVLARRFARRSAGRVDLPALTAQLSQLAGHMVSYVLDDASLTPLGAFNTIRDEVIQLLSRPADGLAAQVSRTLAELADRLLHRPDGEIVVTGDEARQIRTALDGLSALLAGTAEGMSAGPGMEPGEEGDQ